MLSRPFRELQDHKGNDRPRVLVTFLRRISEQLCVIIALDHLFDPHVVAGVWINDALDCACVVAVWISDALDRAQLLPCGLTTLRPYVISGRIVPGDVL